MSRFWRHGVIRVDLDAVFAVGSSYHDRAEPYPHTLKLWITGINAPFNIAVDVEILASFYAAFDVYRDPDRPPTPLPAIPVVVAPPAPSETPPAKPEEGN